MGKAKNTKKKLPIVLILILILLIIVAGWKFIASVPEDPGWHVSLTGKQYYVDNTGEPAEGYIEIGEDAYYFEDGGIPADKGWIDNRYYCEGKGKLATGWKYLNEKVYYFYQKEDSGRKVARQAKNYTTSGKIRIPEEGYVDGKKGEVLAYGIDVLNRTGWSLEGAYRYSASLNFERNGEETYDMEIVNCALQGFKEGKGNCLAWSGTFCVMAKLLGKDCHLFWGTIESRDKDYVHGWTEIWEEDGIHVYDPRKNEGQDLAGFDVRYGEKGTYRYNEEAKEELNW